MRRQTPHYYDKERRKGRRLSIALHLLFLLLAIVGLPSFLNPPPPEEPTALVVELLPITGITNVKPDEAPAPDQKPEPPKPAPEDKKPAPQETKEKSPVKPTPPVKTPEAAPPPPPTPPAPPKEEKPQPKPPEPKKPEPPKPEVKPDTKKDDKKNKKNDEDITAVLKAVKAAAQKEKETAKKSEEKEKPKDNGAKTHNLSNQYDPKMDVSVSERDAIMSQISACWHMPAGAKDAQDLIVVLSVEYNQDGSYISVALADESKERYNTNTYFRAAADIAIHAVRECSPIKGLPPEKYQAWHYMELVFDPKEMLY